MLLRVPCNGLGYSDHPNPASSQKVILTEHDIADMTSTSKIKVWDGDHIRDSYHFVLNSGRLSFRDLYWKSAPPPLWIEYVPMLVYWYDRLAFAGRHCDGAEIVFSISHDQGVIVVTNGVISYRVYGLGQYCETLDVKPCMPFVLAISCVYHTPYTCVELIGSNGTYSVYCLQYIIALSLAQDPRFTY